MQVSTIYPVSDFWRVRKLELAEYRIEEVTNQFESSVNLIRHFLGTKFVQLSLYHPSKNQKQGRYLLYLLYMYTFDKSMTVQV